MIDRAKLGDSVVVERLLTPELEERNDDDISWTRYWHRNHTWLQGKPKMVKSLSLYLSYRACRPKKM